MTDPPRSSQSYQLQLGPDFGGQVTLNEPLEDKYGSEKSDLAYRLGRIVDEVLADRLPQVVFWTYSDQYILSGQTEFDQILNAKSLENISRPLVNLFRIALGVGSYERMEEIVKEIQSDPTERSRYEDKLNGKIQEYLKKVWPEYDQRIKINLEQERIRVSFVDPMNSDPSYYAMEERSQGCQTFISFLLTVGAEAKHGVIRDTILLLDEPETHLHPTGVRYMLRELISAAHNGNTVIYATHSIFMIDKDNYDRHLIIRKDRERSSIQASARNRVGYFIQEEILYDAIGIDLNDALPSRDRVNFVFEGDADVQLFSSLYEHCVEPDSRPYKIEDVSFYQGGKCNDIRKYLKQCPIKLGSVWVFVLDNDEPGRSLKQFIESKYREDLGKYVFVFLYESDAHGADDTELEDLFQSEFLQETVRGAVEQLGLEMPNVDYVDGTSCSTYIAQIGDELGSEEIKPSFKECLNSRISQLADESVTRDSVHAIGQEYIRWFDSTLAKLRGTEVAGVEVEPKSKAAAETRA